MSQEKYVTCKGKCAAQIFSQYIKLIQYARRTAKHENVRQYKPGNYIRIECK